MVHDTPSRPGVPSLRWSSRARSVAGVEAELARIWASAPLTVPASGGEAAGHEERHVAARTSVLNLVVIARRPEIGERAAAVVTHLAGRHPSRTLIVSAADPDGPSWLDARIQAQCMLPRPDVAEMCIELVYLTIGGESGRHFHACVAPLLVHDLPVTVWWPGDVQLGTAPVRDVLALADRVIVDGASWSGDGLARLALLADLLADRQLDVVDLALLRQSRWREAIASAFDLPDLLPFVRSIRSIEVSYAAHEGHEANVVKPLYHVAWLASRLGFGVVEPLGPRPGGGFAGALRSRRSPIRVALLPVETTAAPGTTLRVQLVAERRGQRLSVDVSADGEGVVVEARRDGQRPLERRFLAARRTETDLIGETIESVGRDPIAAAAIRCAAALAGGRRGS